MKDEVTITKEQVRRIRSKIDNEASSHGSNYACGMRLAGSIAESELLDLFKEDEVEAEADD